jgi:hypothetical protein
VAARQTNANPPDKTLDSPHQVRLLRELIEAVDARVPMIERIGETQIARAAALLKKNALQRIAELKTVTVLSST